MKNAIGLATLVGVVVVAVAADRIGDELVAEQPDIFQLQPDIFQLQPDIYRLDPQSNPSLSLVEASRIFASSVISDITHTNVAGAVPLHTDHETHRDEHSSSDECHKCVCFAAHEALEMAMRVVEKFCDKMKDHKMIHHVCKMMKEHKAVAAGFIAHETRPLLNGYSYCVGKGACHFDKDTSELSVPSLAAFDKCGEDKVSESASPDFSAMPSVFNGLAPMSTPRHGDQEHNAQLDEDCRNCVTIAMRHLMHHIVAHIHHMCEKYDSSHSTDSHLARICFFIKHHPAFSYGYLLGMVAPWKFGMGYCTGIGACPAAGERHRSVVQPMLFGGGSSSIEIPHDVVHESGTRHYSHHHGDYQPILDKSHTVGGMGDFEMDNIQQSKNMRGSHHPPPSHVMEDTVKGLFAKFGIVPSAYVDVVGIASFDDPIVQVEQ